MNNDQTAALARIIRDGESGAPIAFDFETNAEPFESPDLQARLLSLASPNASLVLPVASHPAAVRILTKPYNWFAHNAEFDRGVALHALGIDMPPVRDTYTLAHLADPRGKMEGGTGHSLAELAERYTGERKQTDELKATMKDNGWSWATIPIDNPVYLSYARQDAVTTVALAQRLAEDEAPGSLESFEYGVAHACARMAHKGVCVDREYTEALVRQLRSDSAEHASRAAYLGVLNVNSAPQVTRALETPNAAKETLLPIAGLSPSWEPFEDFTHDDRSELALSILRAKRANKWAHAYAMKFLSLSEYDGRLHPYIAPLRARTARMSIANPPLQQLPAGDWIIRRCLVADPGHQIWAVDFEAVEFRVLAALSGDRRMTQLILDGEDLHDNTARLIFGDGFTKSQRKLAKIAGFCVCYGGGVGAIDKQTGCGPAAAKQVRDGFLGAYPGVARFARRLTAIASRTGAVTSRTGRRMPVDRFRTYSALNYVVQSTARDVFAESLLRVEDAGLSSHLLLPIHDELLGQAPTGRAEEISSAVASAMSTVLDGVPITTSASVGLRSWGSLYGSNE